MIRYLSIFLLAIIVFACHSEENKEFAEIESEISFWFPDFPEKPLLNLSFNEEITRSIDHLKSLGWIQNQDKYLFDSKKHAAQIILSEGERLTEFKIIFLDKKQAFIEEIEGFLAKNQSKSIKNNDFSVYSFESKNSTFDVTTFVFEDMYRLHFKPKSWH